MAENETSAKDTESSAGFFQGSKPIFGILLVQVGFAGMTIVSKIALNHGMTHFSLVFYRHLVATLALAPFAYFLERKKRPKLTWRMACGIFVSAMLGFTVNQNLYYASLQYTSATYVCAIGSMVPAITFLMAIVFRLEKFGMRNAAGQAKVIGAVITVGGGMVMTLYKGPALNLWPSPFHLEAFTAAPSPISSSHGTTTQATVKSALLSFGSCVCSSGWFIVQTKIGNSYSAQYSSTTLMCLFATVQSGIAMLIFEGTEPSVWAIGWDIRLLTAVYSGVVASSMCFSITSWCIRKRGPLITTMFNPVQLIVVALLSTLMLDERLHVGNVVGAALIGGGVCSVVWGKSTDTQKVIPIRHDAEEVQTAKELATRQISQLSKVPEEELTVRVVIDDKNKNNCQKE